MSRAWQRSLRPPPSEMTARSEQVSSAIENVSAISEETAASAEEVSAATEEMNASIEEISGRLSAWPKICSNSWRSFASDGREKNDSAPTKACLVGRALFAPTCAFRSPAGRIAGRIGGIQRVARRMTGVDI